MTLIRGDADADAELVGRLGDSEDRLSTSFWPIWPSDCSESPFRWYSEWNEGSCDMWAANVVLSILMHGVVPDRETVRPLPPAFCICSRISAVSFTWIGGGPPAWLGSRVYMLIWWGGSGQMSCVSRVRVEIASVSSVLVSLYGVCFTRPPLLYVILLYGYGAYRGLYSELYLSCECDCMYCIVAVERFRSQ